jgi:hypothetical protein
VTNIIATPGSLQPKSGLPISALKELSKSATADFDWRRTGMTAPVYLPQPVHRTLR